MRSTRDALKSAIRQRRCPPYSIKQKPEWREQYKDHCRVCPFCEADKDNDIDAWSMLADNFLETVKPSPEEQEVQPGDIRLLKTDKNLWKNGFYYSLPVVLVLKKDPDPWGYIPVALTFSETALAGPGDLVAGSLCIETWNIFHVKTESLGQKIDNKNQLCVDAVVAMHKDKNHTPDWAPVLIPIKSNGPRKLFRKYEQEIADFFNENKTMPSVFHFLDKESVMSDLKKKVPGIRWDLEPENIWDLFAMADLPSDYYPNSCADQDFLEYHAILYIYQNNEIAKIMIVKAEAECTRTDSGIAYSIFFSELPVPWQGVFGYAYLKLGPQEIILPLDIIVAMEHGSISVSFEVEDCLTGILQTALFFKED
ncbi:MAG: hypothetical protein PF503_01700 [Desulfobacula sp.]|jgi:hypothetical protein|nr:hypothetical protein [Desulfobacula sp.]